jgi:serine/threonine-protein kinase
MARVHLGRLLGPANFAPIVAIKAMHPAFAADPQRVKMLRDEVRLAALIRHPNVVPVLDVVAEGTDLLLVLDYVHGESFAKLCKATRAAGERIPPGIAAAVVCDALLGLHAAHEAKGEGGRPLGVVHRDVSPQNILVGCDGVGRMLDFGVAKVTREPTEGTDGQIKGKLAYMAPEQLRPGPITRRADVFAAGIVLWEALTGERLFAGDDDAVTISNVLRSRIQSPRARVPTIPAELEAVVMRALSREESKRFRTADEMATALADSLRLATRNEVGKWV